MGDGEKMRHFVATKKPIAIHAVLLDSTKLDKLTPSWFHDAVKDGEVRYDYTHGEWVVNTMEGQMVGLDSDYLIRGVRDELYICNGDVFKETYDAAEITKGDEK